MSKIDDIVKNAIDKVLEDNFSFIKVWYKDNFPCDIWYNENRLGDLTEDELETIQFDWIEYFNDYITELVCNELGIDFEYTKNTSHIKLVEEIYEQTKDKLFLKLQEITNKLIVLQDVDIAEIKEDLLVICNRLNNCKTLQDVADYAIWNNDKLGSVISTSFYDINCSNLEEAIENNVEKEKISFIGFSQLGELSNIVFHFKNGQTNLDSVEFDICDKDNQEICLKEVTISDFVKEEEDMER